MVGLSTQQLQLEVNSKDDMAASSSEQSLNNSTQASEERTEEEEADSDEETKIVIDEFKNDCQKEGGSDRLRTKGFEDVEFLPENSILRGKSGKLADHLKDLQRSHVKHVVRSNSCNDATKYTQGVDSHSAGNMPQFGKLNMKFPLATHNSQVKRDIDACKRFSSAFDNSKPYGGRQINEPNPNRVFKVKDSQNNNHFSSLSGSGKALRHQMAMGQGLTQSPANSQFFFPNSNSLSIKPDILKRPNQDSTHCHTNHRSFSPPPTGRHHHHNQHSPQRYAEQHRMAQSNQNTQRLPSGPQCSYDQCTQCIQTKPNHYRQLQPVQSAPSTKFALHHKHPMHRAHGSFGNGNGNHPLLSPSGSRQTIIEFCPMFIPICCSQSSAEIEAISNEVCTYMKATLFDKYNLNGGNSGNMPGPAGNPLVGVPISAPPVHHSPRTNAISQHQPRYGAQSSENTKHNSYYRGNL